MRRAPPLLIRERFVVFFIDDSGNAIVGIVHSIFIQLQSCQQMTTTNEHSETYNSSTTLDTVKGFCRIMWTECGMKIYVNENTI